MLGAAGAVAGCGSLAVTPEVPRELEDKPRSPGIRDKLTRLSKNSKQLWTVVYVAKKGDILSILERDVQASLDGGADAAVLESGDVALLEKAVIHARKRFPDAVLGANHLGDKQDPYGHKATFRLCAEHGLQIAWVDFSGVDLVKELPEISLHAIEAARPRDVFYVSGIHMKYGTLLDPNKSIEQSALQALGWVDGVVVTGPKTGVPSDPDRVRRVREVIGSNPMGVASGVSVENVQSVLKYVDYCLVNSSIADSEHRLITNKVRELRTAMGS